ncbi:LAFA_0D07052g1_1 [Lachancea sp. 'fantastica']|nr:LAFA_0D07052g1_1 [Lachancea sp. 'fantastica']
MNSEAPRTPTKSSPGAVEENESKIPSPSATGSPKYRKRTSSPKQLPVSASEHQSIISHTKKHKNEFPPATDGNRKGSAHNGDETQGPESSSHMTAFYKENIRILNELQDLMFQKKARLDTLKDELTENKSGLRALLLKAETYKEEKYVKSQQLKLKINDEKKLRDEHNTKIKFIAKNHELEVQQLRAKSVAEMNRRENSYRQKIEELRYSKIKQLQENRDKLRSEISALDFQISNNESTLREALNECEQKHKLNKEKALRHHQEELSGLLEKNRKQTADNDVLRTSLDEKLKVDFRAKVRDAERLNSHLQELEQKLEAVRSENAKIKTDTETCSRGSIDSLAKRDELEKFISASKSELAEIKEILMKEETMRRNLNNELQELRGNIRVFCRLRPKLSQELDEVSNIQIEDFNDDGATQRMHIRRDSKAHTFTFDKIFGEHDSNKNVFEEIGQLIQSSLDGYNVCIFAFGQTGSGKTYTMLNPSDGIIPSTLNHIFLWVEKLKSLGWSYDISGQFIEIYNENLRDLLKGQDGEYEDTSDGAKLEIRHDVENCTTHLVNATTCKFTTQEMASGVLSRALKMRSTAATKANSRSSRSHSVFIIKLRGHNSKSGEHSMGTLNLVDLAGSERINSSQPEAERLRETQNINKSLSCLGDVIHALGTKDALKRHIPFRNSKLTYLLQYSLIGDSKTLMFVNVSPSLRNLPETLNSLRFAAKVNSTKMMK